MESLIESTQFISLSNYSMQFISAVGTILSGIFTVVTAILLWDTLTEQRKQSEKQSIEFQKQLDLQAQQSKKASIENHFYKMLEIARENSNSMKSKDKTGRYVFKQICDNFDKIYKIMNEDDCSKGIKTQYKISISWLIVFYGMDTKVRHLLIESVNIFLTNKGIKITIFKNKHDFAIPKLHDLSDKHDKRQKLNKILPLPLKKYLEFDGYQSILAHYFRHLFQTVQYVNKQTVIDYDEKYHYIRTLRAQLNTFELIVLFYNCFSPYGSEWEPDIFDVSDKDNNYKSTFLTYSNHIKLVRDKSGKLVDHDECINKQLITKYQFFRNITMPLGNNLKVEQFFPMIEYEHCDNCISTDERKKLDKIYKK